MVARRVSSHRAAIEECHGSEEEPVENPFNDRNLIKQLVNGCILPDVIQRIIRTDPEQRVWDSLGSFLEVNRFTCLLLLAPSFNYLLNF